MFSMNVMDYPMSFLLLSTGNFFGQVEGTILRTFQFNGTTVRFKIFSAIEYKLFFLPDPISFHGQYPNEIENIFHSLCPKRFSITYRIWFKVRHNMLQIILLWIFLFMFLFSLSNTARTNTQQIVICLNMIFLVIDEC